jgi:hypothetical protein
VKCGYGYSIAFRYVHHHLWTGILSFLVRSEYLTFYQTGVRNISKVTLKQPIAVFDTGIGSYAIACKIADRFPRQDVLYFVDRANFPLRRREQGRAARGGAKHDRAPRELQSDSCRGRLECAVNHGSR